MPPTDDRPHGGMHDQLAERLHPRTLLTDLLPTVRRLAPVARVGIGLLEPDRQAFRVLALATTDRIARGGENQTFPFTTTAAGWVTEHSRPFVGSSIRYVRRFPQTHEYFVAEQMQSNCILPLPAHRSARSEGVLYFVSHKGSAFPSTVLPALDHMGQAVRTQVEAFLDLQQAPPSETTATVTGRSESGALPTLDEVQRTHIITVLQHTDGVLEGPRGAARILGLAPSTLRNRMRKLGIALRREGR